MRYHDITPIQSSTTHPYVAEIAMKPDKWSKIRAGVQASAGGEHSKG